jgi:hypothetical protein
MGACISSTSAEANVIVVESISPKQDSINLYKHQNKQKLVRVRSITPSTMSHEEKEEYDKIYGEISYHCPDLHDEFGKPLDYTNESHCKKRVFRSY